MDDSDPGASALGLQREKLMGLGNQEQARRAISTARESWEERLIWSESTGGHCEDRLGGEVWNTYTSSNCVGKRLRRLCAACHIPVLRDKGIGIPSS